MMCKNGILVPLFAPSFKRLRADAVWVTIANWAEGLENKYGNAEVFTGNFSYTSEQIRARCFSSNSGKKHNMNVNSFRKLYLSKLLETFLKDLRWFFEEKKSLDININQLKETPFIWQHHDLFQTRGLKIAKKLKVPSVLFVDAPYVWESKKWGMNRFGWEWFAKRWGDAKPCKNADLVLAVSEEVKQAVVELGVDERKILVTPCTVSTKRFGKSNALEFRNSLGLTNDFVIGWVGSFRKFHNLDLLIEAFDEISLLIPQAKLLLVGDGPERSRLQEKVDDLALNDRVIFTGNVPHNQVNEYISSFDLAVLPSQSNDGFHYSPLKLREFFAAGVPVVAAAVGDVKKVIEESRGGWLVLPGSKDSIAQKILLIASDREELDLAGTSARNYAITEMGIAKQIKMIEQYFQINL